MNPTFGDIPIPMGRMEHLPARREQERTSCLAWKPSDSENREPPRPLDGRSFILCWLPHRMNLLPSSSGPTKRNGILGISRILKLRNQLLSHRGNKIRSNDPNSLEDISRKGFSTGVSYMYSSFFEVSQWCQTVDLLGKRLRITLISCFGEISGSRGIERNILYLISKSSYNTSSSRITCRNEIMLIHVPHGQGSIFFRGE
ncbi:hypothetical protein M5K25_028203 [Dendrobium thyrsiflorum]|uniref:ATP synthase YMF19 uncharacterized C-terminal domain-containing protein n=1 Tax=Dendrobium thyrsiflorum TaxID=117978 RepID=A0ABD0TTV0_DENTH